MSETTNTPEEAVESQSQNKQKNEAVLANQNVAPDAFDWDYFESGLNAEDRTEEKELEEIYHGSLNDLGNSDVLTSKV